MAPRLRLPLLARAFARRVFGGAQAEKSEIVSKAERNKGATQSWTDVDQKLTEQDLKLEQMEGEISEWRIKVEKNVELYNQTHQTQEEKIKGALDELRFSFVKAIVTCIGLTTAVGSLAINGARFFLSTGSNASSVGSGEPSVSSQGDPCSAKDDAKAVPHSLGNASEGRESTKDDENEKAGPTQQ